MYPEASFEYSGPQGFKVLNCRAEKVVADYFRRKPRPEVGILNPKPQSPYSRLYSRGGHGKFLSAGIRFGFEIGQKKKKPQTL